MKKTWMLLSLVTWTLGAQQARVAPLMSKDLPDIAGKESVMFTVDHPPGSSDPIHRHNAYAFLYVLEGSIVMQVQGGTETTLTPGQTFYERPSDIIPLAVTQAALKPAKFLVVLLKDKGAPLLVPVK